MRSALSYEDDQVGADGLRNGHHREDVSLEVVLRYLRRLKELPGHTDKLFVVDYDGVLKVCCRLSVAGQRSREVGQRGYGHRSGELSSG